jgi:hypothetical protein
MNRLPAKYGSNTETIYYDVTNFYFEIDRADEMRKYGKSKEHRHNPVVQMGWPWMLTESRFIMSFFPAINLDKETFRSVIGEVRKNYDTGRIIVVADMGVITGDNIYYLTGGKNRNGYVFSFSIRGGTEAFKNYVLDEAGYVDSKG